MLYLLLIFFSFICVESGKNEEMETILNLACIFLLSHLSITGRITSTNVAIIFYLEQQLSHSACCDI